MGHSAEDVRKQVKGYIAVFAALMVLTLVTVAVSYLHLSSIGERVTVALIVATVKASLVAVVFMHLKAERFLVYVTLALTAFFVVLVFALPIWAESDHVMGTVRYKWDAGMAAPPAAEHEPAAH